MLFRGQKNAFRGQKHENCRIVIIFNPDVGLDYFLYDLLPHNKDIQSPAIQDAISIMNQMGERQTEYIVKILKIYQASHQEFQKA